MSLIGPVLPAGPQVGSYLGYTGRDAAIVAKAARDPELPFGFAHGSQMQAKRPASI